MKYEFFTGSWDIPGPSGSITKFVFDTDKGTIEKIYDNQSVSCPYQLLINSAKTRIYVIQLSNPVGTLHVFGINENGVELLQSVSSRDDGPADLHFAFNEKVLMVAHFTGGSFQAFQINDDGLIGECIDEVKVAGRGFDPERQSHSYCHWIEARGEYVFITDLGLDKVHVYHLDLTNGKFIDTGKPIPCPSGFGARQLAFRDNTNQTIYLGCEMGNHIVVCQKVNGEYVAKQIISTVPKGYDGPSINAAIKAYGDYVYIINRGLNQVAMFHIMDDGLLEFCSYNDTCGSVPRELERFGDYILIANTDSNEVTAFKINTEKGCLDKTGISAKVYAPTCICPS